MFLGGEIVTISDNELYRTFRNNSNGININDHNYKNHTIRRNSEKHVHFEVIVISLLILLMTLIE